MWNIFVNYKIFIIYDSNKDTTLDHLKKIKSKKIILIKNNKIGPHSAVLTGFKKTKSKKKSKNIMMWYCWNYDEILYKTCFFSFFVTEFQNWIQSWFYWAE